MKDRKQLADWVIPPDAEIHRILVQRIDVEGQGVGICVGVIDSDGPRVVTHGAPCDAGGPPLNGDTVFEIGSITKVFTALLLADMARTGEVRLDDPAIKYLPAGVSVPERGGKQITLAHLATHTSGLPRSPTNLSAMDRRNIYANYSVDDLYAFLNTYALDRDIGAGHVYSNVGSGLLGHVLALHAGLEYEAVVKRQITDPLGMASTAVALTPEVKSRFAVGHDRNRQPVANLNMGTLAGAGALRSTANDLLIFLAAALGYSDTTLKASVAAQLAVRCATETADRQALGWMISADGAGEIAWHSGGTLGSRCFIGFDSHRKIGVVVLTNMATPRGGNDIGFHLLSGRPLLPRPRERQAIRLGADVLARYAGCYAFSATSKMMVAVWNEQLCFRLTGRGWMELIPETVTTFFLESYDAEVIFETDSNGRVTNLVTRQSGQERRAVRVS